MGIQLSRRAVLKGLGTAMALPFLDAMRPSLCFGAPGAAVVAAAPKRVAWLYVPNGIDMRNWTPATTGVDYELPPTLKPLAPFKDKMMVISGMMCDKANANGDGPGDHSRAMPSYLTGAQARKTEGANIHIGMSVDQAAASRVGHLTRFPSLEMGIEEGTTVGSCDSGYSCIYIHNLSWKNETTPMLKDCDPRSIFDRLFGNKDASESAEASAKRTARRKSMLDFVSADASRIQNSLGAADKRKLDQYMTSIREIEVRMERATKEDPIVPPDGATRPSNFVFTNGVRSSGLANTIRNYPEHIALIMDMMVLAFQTDSTRIITCPFANESSNQSYPFADAPVPHHSTSHHMGDPVKMDQLAKINQFHIKQVAYLLAKLESIQESNGSILDNTLIAYGSGNGDGNRHNHDDLPLLLMGKGGGTVSTGKHIRVDHVPINNLWLSMIERVGAQVDHLGDSTGKFNLL